MEVVVLDPYLYKTKASAFLKHYVGDFGLFLMLRKLEPPSFFDCITADSAVGFYSKSTLGAESLNLQSSDMIGSTEGFDTNQVCSEAKVSP